MHPCTVSSRSVSFVPDLAAACLTAFTTCCVIIGQKIAAAWSKSNLPPRELDQMFRAIEALSKTNRSFLNRLKEIGPNPSSPKPLGDLLMKWVRKRAIWIHLLYVLIC